MNKLLVITLIMLLIMLIAPLAFARFVHYSVAQPNLGWEASQTDINHIHTLLRDR
ncbi:hypothetical protein EDB55_2545 [Vibrio crassostreae]|uniref:hypothetical protein n=1 Tax=Vibrio crassostreae TaxID=246167 RepID=UPI000FBE69A6|nr:hypothetical protein [Vibrio crassostreae]ROR84541.1 hypothetical protein EDB55_2545 [Vibrio crassostreae]